MRYEVGRWYSPAQQAANDTATLRERVLARAARWPDGDWPDTEDDEDDAELASPRAADYAGIELVIDLFETFGAPLLAELHFVDEPEAWIEQPTVPFLITGVTNTRALLGFTYRNEHVHGAASSGSRLRAIRVVPSDPSS